MLVYLVHHAEAVGPDVDSRRPLSARGLAQAERLAGTIHATGAKPHAVWHSGKLRSRQTAEACWRVCNPFAEFKLVKGLRPEDSTVWAVDQLAMEEHDVLLVSHMPLLPALLQSLAGTSSFPLHGVVAIDRQEGGQYVERWRAEP